MGRKSSTKRRAKISALVHAIERLTGYWALGKVTAFKSQLEINWSDPVPPEICTFNLTKNVWVITKNHKEILRTPKEIEVINYFRTMKLIHG
jgi:hypothetical protein